MKFSIKDFFNNCDQILMETLKKTLTENFIFCAVEPSQISKEFWLKVLYAPLNIVYS